MNMSLTQEDSRGDFVLITGGAGFIGTNLAARLLEQGRRVLVYDNFMREGVSANQRWLHRRFGDRVQIEVADTRDAARLAAAVARASEVFHFAAQVAVTTSLADPGLDFDVNLRGTLNLLEAIRSSRHRPPLVFTSTNKVYGALDDIALQASGTRHEPCDERVRNAGISESRRLDFHSPYGCSKGGADQYVLDYARSYGLDAVVLRMSCIYGPHQFGNEDQGWVAHFLIRAIEQQAITLYGDGCQVRDILYVDDLVDAMLACVRDVDRLRGRAFNMGGGPGNTISLVELADRIAVLAGESPVLVHADWRVGDQRWYVSDTRAFETATGWRPKVRPAEGIARLHEWLLRRKAPVHAAMGANAA